MERDEHRDTEAYQAWLSWYMVHPHRSKMAMVPPPSTLIEVVAGISHGGVAVVAVLYHDEPGVVLGAYAPEVSEHAVDNGMEAEVASGVPGATANGEQAVAASVEPEVASGVPGATANGEQVVAAIVEPEAAANGSQGVASGEPGEVVNGEQGVASGVPGAAAKGEQGVASGVPGAAVKGEQGVASGVPGAAAKCGQAATNGEQAAVVTDKQVAANEAAVHCEREVELRGAVGGARGDHGACAQLHCRGRGGHGACARMHCCGMAPVPPRASYHGGDASRAQMRCGMPVARPAAWHGGDPSQVQVHGAPSLVPRHRQPGPAGRRRKAGMHHQRREPEPELRPARRQWRCSRAGASLQERGEGRRPSCSCWWPS